MGDRRLSKRFEHALTVTPQVAGLIYGGQHDQATDLYVRDGQVLRNKNGKPRRFHYFGSVTRTIQPFLDSENAAERDCLHDLLQLVNG